MRRLLAMVLAGLVLAGAAYFAVDVIGPAAPPASTAPPRQASPQLTPQLGDSRPLRPRPKPAPRDEPPADTGVAPPDTGTLHITSDVPGTMVFIDRKYLGNAPVTAPGLAPGTHRLNAAVEGYDGIAEQIDVAPGTRTIQLRMADRRR